jgi:hypothetical protein
MSCNFVRLRTPAYVSAGTTGNKQAQTSARSFPVQGSIPEKALHRRHYDVKSKINVTDAFYKRVRELMCADFISRAVECVPDFGEVRMFTSLAAYSSIVQRLCDTVHKFKSSRKKKQHPTHYQGFRQRRLSLNPITVTPNDGPYVHPARHLNHR